MPFKSEKQRKFMHSQHPAMAKRWEAEENKGKSSALADRLKGRDHKGKKKKRGDG